MFIEQGKSTQRPLSNPYAGIPEERTSQFSKQDRFKKILKTLIALIIFVVIFFHATSQSFLSRFFLNESIAEDKSGQGKQSDQDEIRSVEKYLSPQLQQLLKKSRFYDIHNFVYDETIIDVPFEANRAEIISPEELEKPRKLIEITKTDSQMEELINAMMYPPNRAEKLPNTSAFTRKPPELVDLSFFADEVRKQPFNDNYLQAEYYRFDKMYNIGYYGKQLPICVIMVGKNSHEIVHKTYDSILRQNYSNYRVVHIDDNSNKTVINKYLSYLEDKPEIKRRTWIAVQRRQRNALYNRYFGIKNYCQQGDIVVDIDADDWIIGNQAFQLINSIYQAGNFYKGQKYEVWCAYFNHILSPPDYFPHNYLYGQIPIEILEQNTYRKNHSNWRTSHLRTFLRDILVKINRDELVDQNAIREGQYYVIVQDRFLQFNIVQMSGPKHIKIVDEYLYFYTGQQGKGKLIQLLAMASQSRSKTPYLPLESLDDTPKHVPNYKLTKQEDEELKNLTEKLVAKRKQLKQQVLQLYQRDKAEYFKRKNDTTIRSQTC